MNQLNRYCKLVSVLSSVLLVTAFVAYRSGAFNSSDRTPVVLAISANGSSADDGNRMEIFAPPSNQQPLPEYLEAVALEQKNVSLNAFPAELNAYSPWTPSAVATYDNPGILIQGESREDWNRRTGGLIWYSPPAPPLPESPGFEIGRVTRGDVMSGSKSTTVVNPKKDFDWWFKDFNWWFTAPSKTVMSGTKAEIGLMTTSDLSPIINAMTIRDWSGLRTDELTRMNE